MIKESTNFFKSPAKILFFCFLLFLSIILPSCSSGPSARGKSSTRSASESAKFLSSSAGIWESIDENNEEGFVELNNSKYKVIIDKKGACVSSIIMKEWTDGGKSLDLVLKSTDSQRAFLIYPEKDLEHPLNDVYAVNSISDEKVTLEKRYKLSGKDVVLQKTFSITNDYIIALDVNIISESNSLDETQAEYLYTVEFGPNIGPEFVKNAKSGQNDRKYYLYQQGGKKALPFKFSQDIFEYGKAEKDNFKWAELTGKYFSLIAIPQTSSNYTITAIDNTDVATSDTGETIKLNLSKLYLTRKMTANLQGSDTIYYYVGPQLKDSLKAFDYKEHNSLSLEGMNLEKGMLKGGSFAWLQALLKWIMSLFYKIIPNWGIAIVLLTILVKLLLLPLSMRGMKSSIAMQKAAPELEQLRKQYKNDPVMLNQATLALYKKHKISPMSSFLPILIQLPVLLAMFSLLNNRFELREAVFIPHWIVDLSSPDVVAILPFSLPLLGNEVHILPFIYLATMIVSMLYTQKSSTAQNNGKGQKFMQIGMPIIFFFILYSTSSGLLVYWTVANIISIFQQTIMNTALKKEKKVDENKGQIKGKGPLYNPNLPPKAKK